MQHRAAVVAAAAVGLVAVASCTSAPVTRTAVTRSAITAPACPAHHPAPGWSTPGQPTGQLVPPGAVGLVDCAYDAPMAVNGQKVLSSHPAQGKRLRGAAAVQGYAILLDQQPTSTPACRAAALGHGGRSVGEKDALLFSYADGRTLTLDWGGQCSAVAGLDGHAVKPSFQASSTLLALSGRPNIIVGRPIVARHLVGLTVAQARQRRHRITVDAELVDPRAPLGAVLTQSPVAGSRTMPGNGYDVIVAVPSERACQASDIAMTVSGGGAGAGTAFGALTLRDVSRTACSLRGRLRVSALGSTGQQLSKNTVAVRGAANGQLVLSAHGLTAVIELSSSNFAGNCTGSVAVPTRWRLQLSGSALSIRNTARHDNPRTIICSGKVGLGPATLPGDIVVSDSGY
jgi:Protein of unknown function (DUF4232)